MRNPAAAAPIAWPRLLNRRLAAHYLSVSTAYLDALRLQGLLAPVPLPAARGDGATRVPLFDVRDLDRLVDTCKTGGLH